MPITSSGQIDLNQIHVEAGGGSGTQASLNDSDIRALIGKGSGAQMAFTEWYGASSEVVLGSDAQQISVSSYISSGGTFRIPSNRWVYSNSRTTAALTINIPCTVIIQGKVIGKGGIGGSGLKPKNQGHPSPSSYSSGYSVANLGTGSDGGPAINVTSSGVTIINQSGAYICGGGGGGGSSHVSPSTHKGGGGGAGGADGGYNSTTAGNGTGWPNRTTNGPQYSTFGIYGTNNGNGPSVGFGGGLNEQGWKISTSLHSSGGYYTWTKNYTYGGNAGAPAGFGSGYGSGRIVPGSRVNSPPYGSTATSSYGGAAGETGGNGASTGGGLSGGGGGWGAAGGQGYRGNFVSNQCKGGNAGAAITGTSRSLSNSGTIYGST